MKVNRLLRTFFGWCPTVESAEGFTPIRIEYTHAWCWKCEKYVDVEGLEPEDREPDMISDLIVTYWDYTFLDRIKEAESRYKVPPWKLRCPNCGSMGLTLQSPEDRDRATLNAEGER